MIVHQATRKVVLNLSNPNRVLTVLPHAKMFPFKGRQLMAVPHRLDETRVLRNMGFDVPSPIRYQYEWPGMYKPFHAQLEMAEFLTLNNRAFNLSSMGTGKTIAGLWAYDYLRSIGQVRKALIVAPLSTLERTWGDEVFKHFPHLNASVLHGSKDRRLKLLAQDADIYIINHDGIKVILDALLKRDDIDLIMVDESSAFRNATTDRWKTLHKLAAKRSRVWAFTGTPTPNAPTDAWAQVRIVSPERVPPYFGRWRDVTMKQLTQYKWIPRESAMDTVFDAMQPAIRFSREQCIDLPECLYTDRHVDLTPEQTKAYGEMLRKLATEYNGGQITAVNAAVKMMRLVQIACGCAYGPHGEEVFIPSSPRVEVVREIIEEAGAKVIVFVPFTSALQHVASELAKSYSVAVISGDVTKKERDETFWRFQNDKDPHVLVAIAGTMSHGLTLTKANTVIWYAPVTSTETYIQANARINRPGQKNAMLVVHVAGSEVERRMYAKLKSREKMQGILLDLVQEAS